MSRYALLVLVILTFVATEASGSPWTLERGALTLHSDFDFQQANREFLNSTKTQAFPLSAQFQAATFRFGAQYGFSDRFDGLVELNLKNVSYVADPVIIAFPEDTGPDVSIDVARGSISNFSRTILGVGDARFGVRYNLIQSWLMVTNETVVKLPTGYEKPSSTLDENGLVDDDVTLGDGQSDVENSILFGTYIPETSSYARMGLGFRYRFGAPGHQALGHIKIGQFIGRSFLLFVGTDMTVTVTKGEPIGFTVQAKRDNLTADQVEPDLIEPRQSFLDKDSISLGGGFVIIPQSGVEIRTSFNAFAFGRNIPQLLAVSVGASVTIPKIAGP